MYCTVQLKYSSDTKDILVCELDVQREPWEPGRCVGVLREWEREVELVQAQATVGLQAEDVLPRADVDWWRGKRTRARRSDRRQICVLLCVVRVDKLSAPGKARSGCSRRGLERFSAGIQRIAGEQAV